jgi:hypothetical protein
MNYILETECCFLNKRSLAVYLITIQIVDNIFSYKSSGKDVNGYG